jgi:leucyl-tRNA synthetase
MDYNFTEIEKKWQNEWETKELFKYDSSKTDNKFYLLEMFPYPSGKIHMGHVRNYSIGDVYCRYLLMNGYNLLHPMGWDAFGMPAENAAINNKIHPEKWTKENIEYMKKQLKSLGFLYHWDTEVMTCGKDYYKWGQWLFLKMYERGLAYKKQSKVNWCPECKTVLANEQASGGICWRCDTAVEDKKIEQWFFKITDYVEELLTSLDTLTGWPEQVITMQKNWIGKSYGTEIDFKVVDSDETITVYTTRPDTIFGATYMVLAVDHPLVEKYIADVDNKEEIIKYIKEVKSKRTVEILSEKSEKTGMFLNKFVVNPANGEKIPLWIADYVLMDYGTGAVMAVPAHDERDFMFAKKYELPIKIVIQNNEKNLKLEEMEHAYEDEGVLINSAQFNDLKSNDAIKKISLWFQDNNDGRRTVNYRLRDWGVSRQRYWGNPIPMVYCAHCGVVPVKYEDLPVELPEDIEIGGEGNPLAKSDKFVNTICPKCGIPAKRETDTMDTFVDSSWYYLRYIDAKNTELPFAKEKANNWMQVDQYIGGVEHACLHLIYARFFMKVIRDIGLCDVSEPFKNLLTQGMVIKDGFKMSKSKGNVVDPNSIIETYGSDTARLFCLFAAPPAKELEWNSEGVEGSFRFLNRVWNMVIELKDKIIKDVSVNKEKLSAVDKKVFIGLNKTIKKVSTDVGERFNFNTAIASLMELLNLFTQSKEELSDEIISVFIMKYLKMLSIFSPHISEELWHLCGFESYIVLAEWPKYDEEFTVDDEITIVIQINGKVRSRLIASPGTDEKVIIETAHKDEKILGYTNGKKIIKNIYIKDKLLNIVVK